jgi:hypothetical protein
MPVLFRGIGSRLSSFRDESKRASIVTRWWAHLVGAHRVHPHKHYADYPPQKIEDLRGAGATLLNPTVLLATTFEFTDLRGFSRRSCGRMGWAPLPAHDLPMASRKWLRKKSTYSWSRSSARALMKPRVSFPTRYLSRSLLSVAAS